MAVPARVISLGMLCFAAWFAGCTRTYVLLDDGAVRVPAAARCDDPVSSWAPAEATVSGAWSAVLMARDGTETVLLAIDGAGAHVLRFDGAAATPRLVGDVLLESTGGETPVAFAVDGLRVATAWPSGRVRVHDASGCALAVSASPMLLERGTIAASMALHAGRSALAVSQDAGAAWVEMHDVTGGEPIVHADLAGRTDLAIGLGEGSFTVVAREEGASYFHRFDDVGLTRLTSLGAIWNGATFDGSIIAGVVVDATVLRFPDGRTEERGMPRPYSAFGGISVADGPHGVLVGAAADGRVVLSVPSGEWLELGYTESPYRSFCDQGVRRLGVFFLEGEALRWSGRSCEP